MPFKQVVHHPHLSDRSNTCRFVTCFCQPGNGGPASIFKSVTSSAELSQHTTTRTNAPDGSSGIRITPNADGSYTVVILGIRQNIEITLSTATDNAPVYDATLTLGTAPGALVIANSRPDAATVHVYNLAGILVRQTTVPPGTTHLSVSPGIYIVTDGGAFRRKAAVAR